MSLDHTIPIYSTEDSESLKWPEKVKPIFCQRDYYRFEVEPFDHKKIVKLKVIIAINLETTIVLSKIAGFWKGPIKFVRGVKSNGHTGTITGLKVSGHAVPLIMVPCSEPYIFEYDVFVHFEEGEVMMAVEFGLWDCFCKNLEGVRIVSEESRIEFVMMDEN